MPSHPETNKQEFVTIHVFATESEATVAQAALEAFGIESTITRDDCGGQRPHLAQAAGLRLVVPADDAQSAAEVLKNQSGSA